MREIKFRAWDKNTKKMTQEEYMNWSYWGDCIFGDWGDNWEIMQYTGLLDKNGKEIYEGDVVKSETYPLIKWIIKYDSDVWEEEHYHYAGFTFPEGLNNIEIIGNIYENPELL